MNKKTIIITLVGILIGAVAGYLYYHYVGCITGTCVITSKPINATLYGALIGGLLSNSLIKTEKKNF
ncbi:DUF6132 family protein [Flavobacterium sp. GSA192]|uniref:DUF6132 family protein n=1 Tax=Flavobacterium sp. GSA192 TaxID=2576304 RepID=UPI00112CD5FB|nr:DUF6132 family protein [Flavobacterium sp. GSA192]